MSEYLTTTQSTCRTCRRLVPAQIFVENGGVWLRKECPEHGRQTARIHGDAPSYLKLGHFYRKASVPLIGGYLPKSAMAAARTGATISGTAWRGSPNVRLMAAAPGAMPSSRSLSLVKGETKAGAVADARLVKADVRCSIPQSTLRPTG